MAEVIEIKNEYAYECACGCQQWYICFDGPGPEPSFCYLVCADCGAVIVKDEDKGWLRGVFQ